MAAAVLIAVTACTQNNGNIGHLFGSWVLQSATLNGEFYPMPSGTHTYWSFQADIIRIILEEEHHVAGSSYGTFQELPHGIMRVNFTYSDNSNPEGSGIYSAPLWMGFPASGVFDLTVSGSGDRLDITYIKSPSEVFIYKFSKTW